MPLKGVSNVLLIDRVTSKILFDDKDKCWNWTGAISRLGYGEVKHSGRYGKTSPHRVMYEHYIGSAYALEIHHICGNRKCANPYHLKAMIPFEHTRYHATQGR